MPRLGELLVSAKLLTPEQIEQALAAQVVWGGRLGTNLVELKLLDLDGVTRALGRRHGLPGALAKHFDRADPAVQALLPAALAQRYSVVPLIRVKSGAIAVVAMDPIPIEAHEEIAAAFGVAADKLIVSVAAELRVRYHLERVYGIPRSARFLRSKGTSATPFPNLDDVEEPVETDPEGILQTTPPPKRRAPTDKPGSGPYPQADADDLAIQNDRAVDAVFVEAATAEGDTPPGGVDRRRYVPTLGTAEPVDLHQTTPLGKIAIRRVEHSKSGAMAVVEEPPSPLDTFGDARRAIRRGTSRDKVAELCVQAIEKFVPKCEAAIMLVVRGQVAIGWKWFTRSGTPPPELAVPMDQPGLVPQVAANNVTARCIADDLGAIDMLLFRALGQIEGDLSVTPIVIGRKVMCVIAAALAEGSPTAQIEAIASCAGTAFARLIRDASR